MFIKFKNTFYNLDNFSKISYNMCEGSPCDYNASITITYKDQIKNDNGHLEFRTEVIDLDNTIGDTDETSRICDYLYDKYEDVYDSDEIDKLMGKQFANLGSLVLGYISHAIAESANNNIISLDSFVDSIIYDITHSKDNE